MRPPRGRRALPGGAVRLDSGQGRHRTGFAVQCAARPVTSLPLVNVLTNPQFAPYCNPEFKFSACRINKVKAATKVRGYGPAFYTAARFWSSFNRSHGGTGPNASVR